MRVEKSKVVVPVIFTVVGFFGAMGSGAYAQSCPDAQDVKTFTATGDFEHDVYHLNNFNNLVAQNDQLQIPEDSPEVFPYIWVACSDRGTIVRIATETHYSPIHQREVQPGEILGEYRTAPEWCGTDPSRTTVDFDGNVWCANRQYQPGVGPWCTDIGSVVKIGTGWMHQWIDRQSRIRGHSG